VFSGPIVSSVTDLAWTADDELFFLTATTENNTFVFSLVEIVLDLNTATYSVNGQVTFSDEFANALGGNCDGTLWTVSNLFGFITTQNVSTLSFVQIDPIANTILQRIETTIFTGGDISFTFMNDLFYVTGINVSGSLLGGEELFSFDINTLEFQSIGPLPASTFGTANCNGILYIGTNTGQLYQVGFDPFSLQLIDNTLPNIIGMSVRLMRIPTTTPVAVIELSHLSQRTTWTIVLITLIVPLLVAFSCLFMWLCLCRKKCNSFDPTKRKSYDSLQQLASGRVIQKNYFEQFLLTASNVVKVQHNGNIQGMFKQGRDNAIFSCNVTLYVGNASGKNLYPGNNRLLLNGFLPIPHALDFENMYLYVYDGKRFRSKRIHGPLHNEN
jgi:hypothetical protein